MNRVEEGVANFRDFQQDARDFFTEHRTNEARREEFQNKRDQEIKDHLARRDFWFMLAVALMGLVLGWLTYRDSERKISATSANPVVSYEQKQDAANPTQP
jgi:hypothetical protein